MYENRCHLWEWTIKVASFQFFPTSRINTLVWIKQNAKSESDPVRQDISQFHEIPVNDLNIRKI